LDLSLRFSYTGVDKTALEFNTSKGVLFFSLDTYFTPKTCAYFLGLVDSGIYTNSILQHVESGLHIDGGAYSLFGGSVSALPSSSLVPASSFSPDESDELMKGDLSLEILTGNNYGTRWNIGLAKSVVIDGSSARNCIVFGSAIGSGFQVIDSIAALQLYDYSAVLGSDFSRIPLEDPGTNLGTHAVRINYIRQVPVFPDGSATPSLVSLSAVSSDSAVVKAELNNSKLTLTRLALGSAQITLVAASKAGQQVEVVLNVSDPSSAPRIDIQPLGARVAEGGTLALYTSVSASPSATFQWYQNGEKIPGANSEVLIIENFTSKNAGQYQLIAVNRQGSATSQKAELTWAPVDNSVLKALAVRAYIEASQRMIVGVATRGTRQVLLTGIGWGLTDQIPYNRIIMHPGAEIFSGTNLTDSSATWIGASASDILRIRGSKLDRDDVAFVKLIDGAYSAHLYDRQKQAGIGLMEVIDAGSGTTNRLSALAARHLSGTGDKVLIAGFVIEGTCSKTLIIRGVGPSLPCSVSNRMNDPVLFLYSSTGDPIATNDNWKAAIEPTMLKVMGESAKLTSDKDAVMLLTLPPGAYTVHVKDASQIEGEAVIEIYEVP
jgi:cyclophilin family peptidyl-prolyl cis-trans isomerase